MVRNTFLKNSAVLVLVLWALQLSAQIPQRGYRSWSAGSNWDEAMLVGNGTVGAMILGRPQDETIIVNHGAIFLPQNMPAEVIDQASKLDSIRALCLAGKFREAGAVPVEQSFREGYKGQIWNDPYIPAFDLHLLVDAGNVQNYERSVDFETGVAAVKWSQDGVNFVRRVFASRADTLLILTMEADKAFGCTFWLEHRPVAWDQWTFINENVAKMEASAAGNEIGYRCEFKKQYTGSIKGYEGFGKLTTHGGSVKAEGGKLVVRNALSVTLIMRVDPFYGSGSESHRDAMLQKIDAAGTDVAKILARHVVVHGGLYNRVHLSLGEDAPLGMDAEVLNLNAKKQVVAKMTQARFDAARYNIISATGINPPNLQGLWGSSWTPPWSSDFTQDGNLPTAISSYLMANTPELMQSFFAYQSRMMADYRINAKRLYGARGIYVPGHTGGYTGKCLHYDKEWTLSYWTAGAAWTADFYNDYWLYTGDKDFLKTVGYPYMKEAALFYEDFLIRGKDGKFMFIPSYSPENTPLGGNSQVCINATMDVMASKQLLRNCLAAGKLLGEDAKQLAKWQQILSDLPAYQINPKGELREWLWPGLADNHEHRHASHLYGLWGVVDPEIANSSTLTEATKRTFEQRMKIRARDNGGVMVFGMVNQAWTAAAVHDREATAEIIEWLSSRYWSNSMCSFHDPEGLFNMDLSGGFQSVVIRTLAYSETGKIELFPALPAKWTKGEISGILLRGQISLSKLSWEKGEVSATISSAKSQKIVFTCPILKAELKMNGKTIKPNKQHEFVLTLVENKNYSLQFGID